jgi:hypothetical protein
MSPAVAMNVTSSPMASSIGDQPVYYPGAILDYLTYMLQMICLQRRVLIPASRQVPNIKQLQQEQVQLLVRLALIVNQPLFTSPATAFATKKEQQKADEVIAFTFDVMATIVDEVGEEVKLLTARMLKEKLQDARLKHLLGSVNSTGSVQVTDPGSGLVMVKEGKGVVGDWKPKVWELLDNGNSRENETSLGLGLFGARRG